MKKMLLMAALAAAAALVACQEKEDPTPGPGPGPETKDEVSVSPSTVAFEGEGGTFRVAVTTNVADYSVSGNPDWLNVGKNGSELTLTAAANTVNEARNCNLTVKAGTATASISVSQKAGSPYPGFTVCSSATLEYGGTMLYQFMKPTEDNYGGWGTLSMVDEDGNSLSLWIYTELFMSEEEVELTPGTYVKGADDYINLSLAAKVLTYMPGVATGVDEDAYIAGSYYTSAATEQGIPLVDGTILVGEDGGKTLVKVEMTDDAGNAYKYVYTGDVTINAEGATYPSATERIDVAATLYGAVGVYYGDAIGNGTTTLQLQLYSGDPDNPAVTQYTFITNPVEFSEDLDFSGTYMTPAEGEDGTEPDPFAPGSVVPGYMQELFPGFSMPMGTYVMYSFDDIVLGDMYNSLILEKQENGTYKLDGAIMSTSGDMILFFGISGLEIPVYDGTEQGED